MQKKKSHRRTVKLATNEVAVAAAVVLPAGRASVNITLNAANIRKAKFDNREHLVVPVVAVREGVLNGQFLPFEEFAAYPATWSGIPLPVNHPKKGDDPVSANTPDVLEADVIGRFFNVHLDESAKSLKGELWIDIAKAEAHADGPEILRRLEAGEQLEVSTAYFADHEPGTGVFNGEKYNGIQRNLRPDHLALLPHSVGACNWSDGCGAPRIAEKVTQIPAAQQDVQTNQQEQVDMDKKQIVDALISNQDTPWKEEHRDMLMKLNECELKGLQAKAATPAEKPAAPAAPAVNADQPKTLDQFVATIGDARLKQVILNGVAAHDSRKAELVASLSANTACAFSKPELEAAELPFLEKLASSLNVNYSGKGGPRFNDRTAIDTNDDAPPDPPAVLTAPVAAK